MLIMGICVTLRREIPPPHLLFGLVALAPFSVLETVALADPRGLGHLNMIDPNADPWGNFNFGEIAQPGISAIEVYVVV